MRLCEWEAKCLLKVSGIRVPEGVRVQSPDEAGEAATMLGGPVVIKAQVPTGRRMKAGGIRFASDPAGARQEAGMLLGMDLLGFPVDEVLVERRVEPAEELYLAITYDERAKAPVILGTTEGGVEVEQAVSGGPAKLLRQAVDMTEPFFDYKGREIAVAMGLEGRDIRSVAYVVRRLFNLFYELDATLAEINPLVRVNGLGFVALDAHIDLDDEALRRHPELEAKWGIKPRESQSRPQTSFEQAASRIDAEDHRGVAGRVVEFDGDMGLLIGGGGGSLTVFDAVSACGGRPADYCEIGGNPSVSKIRNLTKLILSRPGVQKLAVIMNVVSNTRSDLVARGVIKGIVELGLNPADVVTVFRIPGAWEKEGVKILQHYGVNYCDRTVSLDEAAGMAVERSRAQSGHFG